MWKFDNVPLQSLPTKKIDLATICISAENSSLVKTKLAFWAIHYSSHRSWEMNLELADNPPHPLPPNSPHPSSPAVWLVSLFSENNTDNYLSELRGWHLTIRWQSKNVVLVLLLWWWRKGDNTSNSEVLNSWAGWWWWNQIIKDSKCFLKLMYTSKFKKVYSKMHIIVVACVTVLKKKNKGTKIAY